MTEENTSKEQELIDFFNPELEFVECLKGGNPSTVSPSTVFKVRKNDAYYIFKKSRKYHYSHVLNERNALVIASDMQNINHLVEDYIDRGVIVKEYFAGDNINSTEGARDFLKNPKLYVRLRELIGELNGKGIAHIDLFETNLLMSPDRANFRLIELGGVILEGEECFQESKAKDQRKIEDFSNYLRGFWKL